MNNPCGHSVNSVSTSDEGTSYCKECEDMGDYKKLARELIEELIQYDAWRENLHVNDFSYSKNSIAQALTKAYEQGRDDLISNNRSLSYVANKVRNETLDEAIKLAEDHWEHRNSTKRRAMDDIAKALKKMKEKP